MCLLSKTTSLVRSWLHRAGVEKRLSLVAIARRPMVRRRGSITASMLRAWWNRDDGGHARSPRRSKTQAAISHAGADLAAENARLRRENERLRMEREILKKRCAFSRKRRDETPPYRGSARDVPSSRHVRCDGRLFGGVLCLAWPARKFAQGGQSRLANRDPAGPYRASRPVRCAQDPCGLARRGV
jgi:transposase-like protein